jgi:hypothetical protein
MLYTGSKVEVSMEHPRRNDLCTAAFPSCCNRAKDFSSLRAIMQDAINRVPTGECDEGPIKWTQALRPYKKLLIFL